MCMVPNLESSKMKPSNIRMSRCILILTVVLLFGVGCFAEDTDNIKSEAVDNKLIENSSPEVPNEESAEHAKKETESTEEDFNYDYSFGEDFETFESVEDFTDKKSAAPNRPSNSHSDKHNYDSLTSRVTPPLDSQIPYTITQTRLKEIRNQFMYWYFDQGGIDNEGDHQRNIHASNPQMHKDLNFQLPFFGFRFNYTRVSMNGYLEFSDPPERYYYPLIFPVKDWPKENDPSFIGIFYSRTRIGGVRTEDVDQRRPGVYYRLERDLETRTDQFGVEMRERVKWDIRESMIGAETFNPKHAIIVTWKNMSFAGGIANALYVTNTFQLVLATDDVHTYAIFNYLDLKWTSHTEAGGDTTNGDGGIPAYVGFNAGNGTQAFEYEPYSQRPTITDLTSRGCANGFKGRHVFRIDEKIMLGTCVTRQDPTYN